MGSGQWLRCCRPYGPPQAAARRAGLEVVEKVLTAAWLVPQELAECLWPAGVSR
jgi:hypothetical protein